MYLLINTSNNDKLLIALSKGDVFTSHLSKEKNFFIKSNSLQKGAGLVSKKTIPAKYKQAEKLLPAIKKLLEENRAEPKNLKGIIVVKGPGSFTALRVGVVTANTLGFALGIPVVGMKCNLNLELVKGKELHKELKNLIKAGVKKLRRVKAGKIVRPFYENCLSRSTID